MELELWQAALLTAVGVAGGFLNVMAGGGSLITVPVMVSVEEGPLRSSMPPPRRRAVFPFTDEWEIVPESLEQ